MLCLCARCGENLTAPIFIDGKPYGWTCARIVKPGIRKSNKKEQWVVADSVATVLDASTQRKHKIRATYQGKGFIDWHYPHTNLSRSIVILSDRALICLSNYKQK